jgi:hypothetical protein
MHLKFDVLIGFDKTVHVLIRTVTAGIKWMPLESLSSKNVISFRIQWTFMQSNLQVTSKAS